MNLQTFYDSTKKVSPYRSKYVTNPPGEPFELIDVVPNLNNKTICFVFQAKGITEPTNHLSFIEFRNVKFIPEDEFTGSEINYYDVAIDGKIYWIPRQKTTNTVRCACSCSDYYFVFSYWNWLKHVHYGKRPILYVRKTPPPPQGRPYVNPEHHFGFCKHIWWSIQELYELGYLQNLNGVQ